MIKCEICHKTFKDIKGLSVHIRIHTITSKCYYDKYLKKKNEGICVICKKETNFDGMSRGYSKTCSRKCGKVLSKKTNIKKYGVLHTLQCEKVKDKSKKTCLKKYGTEYANQSTDVKEKIKQTCLEKYGANNPLGSKEIQEKAKQTRLKKYGAEYTLLSEELIKKVKQTNLDKYGVEYATQSSVVKEKTKQTCLELYGETTNLKCEETKKQIKKTNLEKYGVENPLQSDKIKNKVKQTSLERYGVENTTQKHIINFNKWDDALFNKKTFLDDKGHLLVFEMMGFFNVSYGMCYKHMKNLGIDYILQKGTSHYEQEILEFLQSLGITNIIQNDRELICPKELDFYLPEYKLAIEFDGIYWHAEQQGKTKYYHRDKTDACEEKGVQLIHIFETEWVGKKEIIKSILEAKLNMSTKLCYARQCVIKEITVKESGSFVNANHRQGTSPSSLKLGAYYRDELVSVMTFSRPSIAKGRKDNASVTDFELARFVTKLGYHIPGIGSKIFSFFKKNYEWKKLVTYADRRYSSRMSGAFYEKIGFEFVAITAPCYWYFEFGSIKLTHRFRYRKSELKKLLDTFDPKLTEYTNMLNNNFDRVWDCGNFKFEYKR